jgi:hypothetical protein
MTTFPLHSWRNFLYTLPQTLQQSRQLDQVRGAEQCTARRHLYKRVYGNDIGPTGWNGNQMLAFTMEVDSVLTPSVQIGDKFKLLSEPGVKRVSDSEASTQAARFRCS